MFTQGEPEDSHWWFPCWDAPGDRATSELRVTVPASWVTVAAGERVDRVVEGGRLTEHWRMSTPHPAYLVTLVAGELAVLEDEWDGIPLLYLVEPRYVDWAPASFGETGAMLEYFSELTGLRYPYPKYSQACVQNFPFGGMENISATTLTELTLDDERGNRDDQSHSLVAHEAAHQWFGNLVTCDDWAHIWLNEGFATYLTLLYFEHSRGADEFRARLRDAQDEYTSKSVGARRRPTVTSRYRDPIDLFDVHAYPGGAARLHHLRFVLGDEVFVDVLRAYVAEYAARNAVTADFQRVAETVSGRDLDWFFDQWFLASGYPEFRVSWRWDGDEQRVRLRVIQEQKGQAATPDAFRTPVDVEVRDAAGTTLHRLEVARWNQTFDLPAPREPLWVRFDKYGWIPKELTAEKRPEEWVAIASRDDDVNGRRDAVRALGELATGTRSDRREIYVAELANRLRRDTSPYVRAAAATALGRAGGLEARGNLVRAASGDPAAPVRVAALQGLAGYGPDEDLAELAAAAFDAGYSYATMAAAAGLYAAAAPGDARAFLAEALQRPSPHDQLRAALLEHVAALGEPEDVDELLRWAADETVHPHARRAAVQELGELADDAGKRRAAIRDGILPLLKEQNFRLRMAALETLGRLGDSRAERELAGHHRATVFPRERRVIEAAFDPSVIAP